MSLFLTSLRLATIAALTNGGIGPFPTIAADNVFDSRQDPTNDLDPDQWVPTISVYTEQDLHDEAVNTPGRFRSREIGLSIGYEVGGWHLDDENTRSYVVPETTAALELSLDMLSHQIRTALFASTIWGNLWRSHLREIKSVSSVRFATSEHHYRLASREFTFAIEAMPDCDIGVWTSNDPLPPPEIPEPLAGVLQTIFDNGGGDTLALATDLNTQIANVGLPPDQFLVAPISGFTLEVPHPGLVPQNQTPPIIAGGPTDL
ncbi:MAG: hypothetical protein ABJO09_01000 [Hyphomicrobiales bacterium]